MHRQIFIFITGVVPEILGAWAVSRWLKQHKVSTNPNKVYILGVEHKSRERESREQRFLASKSFLKLSICHINGFGISDCLLRLERVKVIWTCKSVNPIGQYTICFYFYKVTLWTLCRTLCCLNPSTIYDATPM
jgi:hypothetical protein